MRTAAVTLVTALVLLAAGVAAEDTFYSVPLNELVLTEGQLPEGANWHFRTEGRGLAEAMQPYAALDGEGEAVLDYERLAQWDRPSVFYEGAALVARTAEPGDITGHLYVPSVEEPGMVRLAFKVPADAADPAAGNAFHQAKLRHYERLRRRNIPGAAWFRYQEQAVRQALTGAEQPVAVPEGPGRTRPGDLEDTYAVFTGGRAISENLQLDRTLILRAEDKAEVDIAALEGITVQEMDWAPLIEGLEPESDPLAAIIPADQHALFFPSFQAMLDTMDEAASHGTPVLRLMDPRSEDGRTRERYERQLCMKADVLSRLLGPQVIASVAFTGSDPYLRTGTDVAVLFEARDTAALRKLLAARHVQALQASPGSEGLKGEVGGVAYTGVKSPDRSVCSYHATVGGAVVVTNSLQQLGAIVAAAAGQRESLASLPEYTFMRSRYPRGDKEEAAFLIVSDAAIRRWCEPRWRIGASRRTRAAAFMANVQAQFLDPLAKGHPVLNEPISTPVPGGGQVWMAPWGATSTVYGTLEFLTPVVELPLDKVTKLEAESYKAWRRSYQRNWRQYFDPIAVRFTLTPDRMAADVTVMPLIEGSDYREFVQLVTGAKIAPDAGDHHEGALIHFAMAINKESPSVRSAANFLQGMVANLGMSPLDWLGGSLAVYADEDPFWDKLRNAEDPEAFMRRQYHRLPLALHVEVKGALRCAAFLTAVRAYVEQSAPGMTLWETLDYNGQPYVRITPSAAAKAEGDEMDKLAVYYAVTPKELLLTLSEGLLQRTLARQATRRLAAAEGEQAHIGGMPWLGESLCLQADRKVLGVAEIATRDDYRQAMQLRAWGNMPILNEWKGLYPDQDPVALHQKLWQTRLVCPGGGQYVWNERWQTMESTVYGHPGEPKEGPPVPPQLARFVSGNFGVTFEHGGLRARASLQRTTQKQ